MDYGRYYTFPELSFKTHAVISTDEMRLYVFSRESCLSKFAANKGAYINYIISRGFI
jgi:hypothetical protein